MPKTPETKGRSSISIEPLKQTKVIHEGKPDVKNIYEALAEAEKTVRELSRMFAELPYSRHRRVGGSAKMTHKEKIILHQLMAAQKRADRLIEIIHKVLQ